jgi:hypothetical protein
MNDDWIVPDTPHGPLSVPTNIYADILFWLPLF